MARFFELILKFSLLSQTWFNLRSSSTSFYSFCRLDWNKNKLNPSRLSTKLLQRDLFETIFETEILFVDDFLGNNRHSISPIWKKKSCDTQKKTVTMIIKISFSSSKFIYPSEIDLSLRNNYQCLKWNKLPLCISSAH